MFRSPDPGTITYACIAALAVAPQGTVKGA
jgi:hypothetical protein